MSRWQIYEVTTDADGVDCYIKRGDIVRCKECRYYHQLYGCQKHDDIDLVTSDDDYCSYGERKSDE